WGRGGDVLQGQERRRRRRRRFGRRERVRELRARQRGPLDLQEDTGDDHRVHVHDRHHHEGERPDHHVSRGSGPRTGVSVRQRPGRAQGGGVPRKRRRRRELGALPGG
ncbi:unnamed protein product, partial [Ectocarpus fasciculatus]